MNEDITEKLHSYAHNIGISSIKGSELEYESYDQVSGRYDKTRAAIGLEIIHGCIKSVQKPIQDLHLIDAGCGTGNYSVALAESIGTLFCFDASSGMLAKTKEKLVNHENVHFEVANILDFPSPDSSADVILINQVLHHVEESDNKGTFENTKAILKCAHEKLRPGGVFILNTSSPIQLTDGFWWADLIPEAVAKISRRFTPLDVIRRSLNKLGFHNIRAYASLDEVLQQQDYLNLKGPLQDDWRNGDSTWSLVTEKELQIATDRLIRMLDDGSIHTYIEKREDLRRNIGQTTFIVANKSNSSNS